MSELNMISQLRQRVKKDEKLNPEGVATITAAEYDQLQTEWILRTLTDEVEQLIEAVNTFISASREDAETIIPAAEWGIMKQKLAACQHLRNKGE